MSANGATAKEVVEAVYAETTYQTELPSGTDAPAEPAASRTRTGWDAPTLTTHSTPDLAALLFWGLLGTAALALVIVGLSRLRRRGAPPVPAAPKPVAARPSDLAEAVATLGAPEALLQLVQASLAHLYAAAQRPLPRARTNREALRELSLEPASYEALAFLIGEAERVRFALAPLSEGTLDECRRAAARLGVAT